MEKQYASACSFSKASAYFSKATIFFLSFDRV
jgi:hypothetical protein